MREGELVLLEQDLITDRESTLPLADEIY